MPAEGNVFLLDDEPGMLKALTRLLKAEGYAVRAFTSAKAFLESYQPQALGCLVLDVAMPEIDGLELQRCLTRSGELLPIVFLTGHGDIPMSVQAIKAGAEDFLTKPVNDADLLRAVRAALQRAALQGELIAETSLLHRRHSTLTAREREVMAHIVAGELNKVAAARLGVGEHTIKVHRARVMEKMGAESLADLVRAAERLGLETPANPNQD
ncbi:MAG: response regulator transcription factor [Steroidobacteraceae bacterium]